MLDVTQRPAVVTRVQVDADARLAAVMAAIESDLGEGAVGITMEPVVSDRPRRPVAAPDPGAGAIPRGFVAAAATLTAVTVAVDSPAHAVAALQAGAAGIMVRQPVDARLRAAVVDHGGAIWLTGITDPPGTGPVGERLILDCPVECVPRLARLLGSGGSPVATARIACSLPAGASTDDGVLEALVTMAIAGGATVLRCRGAAGHAGGSDVRTVRRCADVAMELLLAGGRPNQRAPERRGGSR